MPGMVTGIVWHPRINAILVGSGDRQAGCTHVLYDPSMSEKGPLLCVGKAVRKPDPFDYQPPLAIHTPGSLPLFRDDLRKRKRSDTVRLTSPLAPPPQIIPSRPHSRPHRLQTARAPDAGPNVTSGSGGGGRIGSTPKTLLTHYLMEKQGLKMLKDQMDPREAILRHKDAGKELAPWTAAYAKTQPERIFAEPEEDEAPKK